MLRSRTVAVIGALLLIACFVGVGSISARSQGTTIPKSATDAVGMDTWVVSYHRHLNLTNGVWSWSNGIHWAKLTGALRRGYASFWIPTYAYPITSAGLYWWESQCLTPHYLELHRVDHVPEQDADSLVWADAKTGPSLAPPVYISQAGVQMHQTLDATNAVAYMNAHEGSYFRIGWALYDETTPAQGATTPAHPDSIYIRICY